MGRGSFTRWCVAAVGGFPAIAAAHATSAAPLKFSRRCIRERADRGWPIRWYGLRPPQSPPLPKEGQRIAEIYWKS